jgi:hypothetical protein
MRDIMEKAKKIDENHVYVCQTTLVDDLLNKNIFSYDDIINLYDERQIEELEKAKEKLYDLLDKEDDDNKAAEIEEQIDELSLTIDTLRDEPQEIYEWWVVSNWLAEKLEEKGEPILKNEYGIWWGRTCTGQAIYIDDVILEIAKETL